jgi:hypothetical protein
MVYNTAKHAKLPMRNATMMPHTGRLLMKGEGMGSVLLRTGGPGAGSSYMDIDDYIATTGINPYARPGAVKPSGTGLSKKISEKLSKLSVIPDGVKRKNITMSF